MATVLSIRRNMLFVSASTLRNLSTTPSRATAWSPGPSPPRLPKDEQDVFEQLQKQSTGAFSSPTPRVVPKINQSPQALAPVDLPSVTSATTSPSNKASSDAAQADVRNGDELHPNVRRGAPPEFEGDRNPKTGEQNGPKVEPLRWGGGVDWSYNGRESE